VMKVEPILRLEMRIQLIFSSNSFRPLNNPAISLTVNILRSYKAFCSLVNFFSQMTLLCSQTIARRSSTQPCTWAVEPPNGFEPYLDLLENQSPSCIINHWDRFEQQFFTLFGDPNEV
ncbi:hypothetical protein VP01_14359g1, partial [Puccinia sorghi]